MAELNIAATEADRKTLPELAGQVGFSAFVGGPLDGRHMNVVNEQSWVVARDDDGKEVRYHRHWLAGKEMRWSFFVIDGCDIDTAIGCLVHGYPGISGFKDDNAR